MSLSPDADLYYRRIIGDFEAERGVQTGLRRTTSDALNSDSHACQEFIARADSSAVARLAGSVAVEGPLPYALSLLPYGLLEKCEQETVPILPTSGEAAGAVIDAFWPGKYALPTSRWGRPIKEEQSARVRQTLQRVIGAAATKGGGSSWDEAVRSIMGCQITTDQWQQYAVVHQRQLASEQPYTLDRLSWMALTNFSFNEKFGIFRHAIGRHTSFLFAEEGTFQRTNEFPQLPIGPYGPGLTRRILLTSCVMARFAGQNYSLYNDCTTPESYNLLSDNTTRANSQDAPLVRDSFVAGVQEADHQAMSAALALLTSSRVPGFDYNDGPALVDKLLKDDMINELAIHARQGLVASAALYGVFIPDLVDTRRDGRLCISASGHDRLKALQEISNAIGAEEIAAYTCEKATYELSGQASAGLKSHVLPPRPLIRTFKMCPYAGVNRAEPAHPEPGAITQRSIALREVFRSPALQKLLVSAPQLQEY